MLSTEGSSGSAPPLTAAVADLPEINAVTGSASTSFLFEGHERDLVAVDAALAAELCSTSTCRAGAFDDLETASIFLHEDPARDLGLAVGDQVTVEFATGGPQQLTVAGTYADSTYVGNYLIDMALFTRVLPDQHPRPAGLRPPRRRRRPGRRPDAPSTPSLADHPQVKLDDRAGYQADQEAQFDSILIAVNGLLGLALFIALLGIANTLALSVLERTREIGLLRAVGMVRGRPGRWSSPSRPWSPSSAPSSGCRGDRLRRRRGDRHADVGDRHHCDPVRTIGIVVAAAAVRRRRRGPPRPTSRPAGRPPGDRQRMNPLEARPSAEPG